MPCPAAVLLRTSPQPALHPCLLRSYTKLYKKHVKIMFPRVSGEGNGCCSEGSSRPCCTCIAVQVQGPMCCVWLFVSLTASSRRARPPGRHRRLPHARPPRNPHRRQRELTAACLVYGSLAVQLVRPDCRPPAPPFGAAPPVSTCLLMLPAAALPTHPPAAVGHGPHPLPAVQRRHARPRDWQQRRRAAPRCDGVSLFDLTKRVAVLPARAPSLKRRNSKQAETQNNYFRAWAAMPPTTLASLWPCVSLPFCPASLVAPGFWCVALRKFFCPPTHVSPRASCSVAVGNIWAPGVLTALKLGLLNLNPAATLFFPLHLGLLPAGSGADLLFCICIRPSPPPHPSGSSCVDSVCTHTSCMSADIHL